MEVSNNLKEDFKGKRSSLQLEIKGRITGDMMELVEGLKGAMFSKTLLCAALHAERMILYRREKVEECEVE